MCSDLVLVDAEVVLSIGFDGVTKCSDDVIRCNMFDGVMSPNRRNWSVIG